MDVVGAGAVNFGMAASTIRRFEGAADAEADGVLALVGWQASLLSNSWLAPVLSGV